jgi:hypothetical protein
MVIPLNAHITDVPNITMERRASITWTQRLKRVFNIDIENCRHATEPSGPLSASKVRW